MPDGLNTYKSTLTPQEVDDALRNIGNVQQSVSQAAGYAQTAQQYGTIVQQNQTAIQAIEDNLAEVQGAAQNAADAKNAAASATASASAASQSAADAEDAAGRAEAAAGINPDDYYKKDQIRSLVPFLYKATFLATRWTGSGPYTQTVTVQAVDGGPGITSNSIMTSPVYIDDTVQGDAKEVLKEAASLVDGGHKTFGYGTITCVIQGEKPAADAEVYFNARKGGV